MQTPLQKPITLVGFGDSITEATNQLPDPDERWLNLLKKDLEAAFPAAAFTVVNAGVGGNSAREAMARFDRDVLAHAPDWLLLEFGGNNDDPGRPERRVAPEEFQTLLEDCRRRLPPQTRIIVITFPPVIDGQHAWGNSEFHRPFGGPDASTERYRQLTRQFAATHRLPLVDLSAELRRRIDAAGSPAEYIFPDGVHLTAAGNRVLAAMTLAALRPHLAAAL
ncbi:MAG: SGNH/GDSL hydrolase family protein [Lentisphaeria bacterium]